jgi:hypothetical protein
LVAAVYEFDHWLDGIKQRNVFGAEVPETVSPFAKVQSISAVYFPHFSELISEMDIASTQYVMWTHQAGQRRLANNVGELCAGFNDAYSPYGQKREALVGVLKKFAHKEFQ